MKRLFDYAEQYLKESDWRTIAMLKFCLFSMGLFTGTYMAGKKKGYVRISALIVFAATYIPLMAKLFGIIADSNEQIS